MRHARPASDQEDSCTCTSAPALCRRTTSTPGGRIDAAPTCEPPTAMSSNASAASAHRLRAATAAPTASMSSSSPTRIAPSMLFSRMSRPPCTSAKSAARASAVTAAASSRTSARLASPGGVTFTRSMSSASLSISAVSASSASSAVLASASRSVIPLATAPAGRAKRTRARPAVASRARQTRRENGTEHRWRTRNGRWRMDERAAKRLAKSAGTRGALHSPRALTHRGRRAHRDITPRARLC